MESKPEKSIFSWDWDECLGKGLESPEIRSLISRMKSGSDLETKTFPKTQSQPSATYISAQKFGIQLVVTDETLKYVYLYGFNHKKFRPYEGKLPYGIDFSRNLKSVIEQFGEPNEKGGGRMMPVWVSYDHLGMEIQFQGSQFQDPKNPISHISIFPECNQDPKSVLCGICRKPAFPNGSFCKGCNLVKYCQNEKCEKLHEKMGHKKWCGGKGVEKWTL